MDLSVEVLEIRLEIRLAIFAYTLRRQPPAASAESGPFSYAQLLAARV